MLEGLYRHDGWGIGVMRAPISALLGTESVPAIEWLPLSRPHTFFADPFAIRHRGQTYCFFEELPYRSRRGQISYALLDDLDRRKQLVPQRAIARPFHLSYPFLVAYEDEIICIPEAFESGRVTAYAARSFPDGWYERATLLEGVAGVDPTIFRCGSQWWLFCTDGRNAWNAELYAWYADDLFGRWRPHAHNPIKRDIGSARPGGTPFQYGGRLFRPAQNCSARYGGCVTLCEIAELGPDRFEERIVGTLSPDPEGPYPDGLHTLGTCGDVTVVDGNRLHFEAYESANRIARCARKMLRRPA